MSIESPTAECLKKMLERHPKITQRDIATKLGMSNSSAGTVISNYKSGRSGIPLHQIEPLCAILGEKPDELFITALKEYHPLIEPLIAKVYRSITR